MKMKIVCILLYLQIVVEQCRGQISYPENINQDKEKSNAAGRLPLYAPTRCKRNELLYPGDKFDDWICDCAPGHVYYPEAETCYAVFRQGPCDAENILVLGRDKIIPECIRNPCKKDGQIPISKRCYELNTPGPCRDQYFSSVLAVNHRTLQVDCVKLSVSLENRFGGDESASSSNLSYNLSDIELCARGTKRAIEGRCPPNIFQNMKS